MDCGPKNSGFSLVELLCVIAIISTLTTFAALGLVGSSQSGRIQQNVAQMAGLLAQSHALALSQNTYVYVFFSASAPAPSSTTQVQLVVVYSATGLDVFQGTSGILDVGRDSSLLTLAHKRVTLDQAELLPKSEVPQALVNRPQPDSLADLGQESYQLTFQNQTYDRVLIFRPNGVVAIPQANSSLSFPSLVEFALEPASAGATINPLAYVIQVAGTTGQANVYRAQ